jgi:hypothetical protein
MTQMLFFENSYSWEITFGLALAGFALGFVFKSAVIYKQRKRILRLEDEMLANHARILALEKKIADSKRELNRNGAHEEFEFAQRNSGREVKVS